MVARCDRCCKDSSVRNHKLSAGTLRRILRFAVPYRRYLAVFLVLVAIDAASGAVTPLLFREIIDRGIVPGDKQLVVLLSLVVALLAIFASTITLAQRWFSARIGEGLVYDLRTAVFDHVQQLPVAFFSRTQTGALIQRLNGDVLGAQQAFTSTLSNVVSNLLSVALVLGAMFVMSWQITLLALVLLPLFILPARLIAGRLREATAETYRLNATMAQTMTERFNVAGAVLAKVFGRTQDSSKDFAGKAARVRDIGVTTAMYAGIFRVSLTLVAALAVALVYGVGGVFAVQGALGIGTVVALTAYLNRLYGPLTALSNIQVDVMTTLVSFERVLEVLDLPPMVADRKDAKALPATVEPSIEFDHVSFHYPSAAEVSLASLESVATLSAETGEEVLKDVSFSVEPGQMVAVVGPSGAGKTTLASLVSRMYDVTGGALLVGGQDVREVTQRSLRDVIGVVTQDSHMYHDTIRSNLLLARPDATEADLQRSPRGGPDRDSDQQPARRPRHRGRRPRLPVVRRRTPATRDRPAAAQGAVDRHPRRGHRPPGLGVGGRRSGRTGQRAGRAYVARHRAPTVDNPQRRHDPRPRRRPDPRTRHPRRAARRRRPVRRALHHPVREGRLGLGG